MLAIVFLALTPCPSMDRYVDPERTSGDGSSATPYPTLGAALAVAQFGDTIHIRAPTLATTCIAPASAGGKEGDFPLQLVSGVHLIGENGSLGPPKVRIVTSFSTAYEHWDNVLHPFPYLVPASERAYFKTAYAVTIENLVFDGSQYLFDKFDASITAPIGVLSKDARNVAVVGCQFVDLFDGLVFRETRGSLTSGTVTTSTFSGSFPQYAYASVGNLKDRGHAGLRVEVARANPNTAGGIVSVSVGSSAGGNLGCTFSGNHDGIETGSLTGDFVSLGVYDSTFTCNESAMEIVGSGTNTVDIDRCHYRRNYNRTPCEGGYPLQADACNPTPTGAVLQPRGTGIYLLTIHNTEFVNNAIGVLWSSDRTESSLDMGTTTNPGLNRFALGWDGSTANPPPYTIGLFTQAQGQSVKAAGNLWIQDNQGATGESGNPGGFYRGIRRGTTVATANLWVAPGCSDPLAYHPPTVAVGPPSSTVGRNYTQLGDFATPKWAVIDFGFVDANGQNIAFPISVLALVQPTLDSCPCAPAATLNPPGCTAYTGSCP